MRRVGLVRVLGILLMIALIAAACGDDSDDTAVPEPAAEQPAEESTEEPPGAPEDEQADGLPDTAFGAVPEGATVVELPDPDFSVFEGTTLGIISVVTTPGTLRLTDRLTACVESNGGSVDYQDIGGINFDQVQPILEGFQAAGVDVVFNLGIDMVGREAIANEFANAGVPFLMFGAVAIPEVVAFDANQKENGRILASLVTKEIGGSGDVLIVNSGPLNGALADRETGMEEVFANFPDITTTTVDPQDFTIETAQAVTETAFQANPGYAAVIGGFSNYGIGVSLALDTLDTDAFVVTADGSDEEYDQMQATDNFLATMDDPHRYVADPAACTVAASMLAGNPPPGAPGIPIIGSSILVTNDEVPAEGDFLESTPRTWYQLSG